MLYFKQTKLEFSVSIICLKLFLQQSWIEATNGCVWLNTTLLYVCKLLFWIKCFLCNFDLLIFFFFFKVDNKFTIIFKFDDLVVNYMYHKNLLHCLPIIFMPVTLSLINVHTTCFYCLANWKYDKHSQH